MDSVLDFLSKGLLDLSWWQVLLVTLALTHVTIAAVTIFLHRCQAHRALELHAIPSHFFRFWLWMTTGMVTKEWAAIHRKHHAKCETHDDPHSPQAHGIRTVLFRGAELYRAEAKVAETMDRYGHGTPDDWIERNLYTKHSALGVSLMLIINVLLFGVLGVSVWAIQMVWIPITAAGIINGLGHWWGYRNFDCADASTNVFPWGILIGGEELHNNHHSFATSAKLSNKWYEFDIGWMYIRMMEMAGLARVKKVAPKAKLIEARQHIDIDALQAVIQNRYDVMAAYAAEIKRVCKEEAARLREKREARKARLLESAPGWLHVDGAKWTKEYRAKLAEVTAASEAVRKLLEMRSELDALWARSSASREQLAVQLQQWCARAEASGVRALQQMSVRLRSYAA